MSRRGGRGRKKTIIGTPGDRRAAYDRHSIVSLEPVLTMIRAAIETQKLRVDQRALFNDVSVRVDSLRLQTFATKGCTCVKCGLTATHFAIERTRGSKEPRYHLNLWASLPDGAEVIFTHDHILSRALGGKDRLDNAQTMCGPCNWEKSIEEGKLYIELKAQNEKD